MSDKSAHDGRGALADGRGRIDVHTHLVPPFWAKELADHEGDPSGWRASPKTGAPTSSAVLARRARGGRSRRGVAGAITTPLVARQVRGSSGAEVATDRRLQQPS